MMSERKKNMPFWLAGEINPDMVCSLKNYLYDCMVKDEDAILMISADHGSFWEANDILQTLSLSNIHLTTIGYGRISWLASLIFCLGDERILMDEATIELYKTEDNIDAIFTKKTGIDIKTFKRKTNITNVWYVSKEDCEKYKITTKKYSEIIDLIIDTYRQNKVSEPLKPIVFVDDINSKSVVRIIDNIFSCAATDSEFMLEIVSFGGEITSLFGVLDTIKNTKVKTTFIASGTVCSAAAVLFLTGERRFLKPGTRFLLHQVRRTINNLTLVKEDMESAYKSLKRYDEQIVGLCTEKTKISKAVLRRRISNKKDWVIKEKDWEKYGLSTCEYEEIKKEIIESRKNSK